MNPFLSVPVVFARVGPRHRSSPYILINLNFSIHNLCNYEQQVRSGVDEMGTVGWVARHQFACSMRWAVGAFI